MNQIETQRTPNRQAAPKLRSRDAETETVLRFSPTAWAKLLFFRDHGQTEIGGFGIARADDLLFIEEFMTVKQEVTMASVAFDDEAVADLFDMQVDLGRKPEQFARIWLHSHPGQSPQPSPTDEETFDRVFGRCQWAVMFVVAKGGRTYARLRFNLGPGGDVLIPTEVDYNQPFAGSDQEAWGAEYKANIQVGKRRSAGEAWPGHGEHDVYGASFPDDWLEELEAMEPGERSLLLDELTVRRGLWEEGEVFDGY